MTSSSVLFHDYSNIKAQLIRLIFNYNLILNRNHLFNQIFINVRFMFWIWVRFWVRSWLAFWSSSWSAFIDCSSNLSFDNSIWCWYSFWSSFASTDLTFDILINASTFRFCFFDWYMILKLYSDNFSAHLVYHLISSLIIMKYFKFRWSMKILIEISVHFNSEHQCFKQQIMISSFLS